MIELRWLEVSPTDRTHPFAIPVHDSQTMQPYRYRVLQMRQEIGVYHEPYFGTDNRYYESWTETKWSDWTDIPIETE